MPLMISRLRWPNVASLYPQENYQRPQSHLSLSFSVERVGQIRIPIRKQACACPLLFRLRMSSKRLSQSSSPEHHKELLEMCLPKVVLTPTQVHKLSVTSLPPTKKSIVLGRYLFQTLSCPPNLPLKSLKDPTR